MKEVIHYQGQFYSWKTREAERDQLILRLIEMSFPLVALFVTAPCDTEGFKRLPVDQRKKLVDPQYCGFEGCMKIVIGGLSAEHDLHVVCDSTEEYSEKMLGLYLRMRRKDAQFKKRCIAITFAEDNMFPPLQLADIVAYCERHQRTTKPDEQHPLVRQIMKRIKADGSKTKELTYAADGPGLGSGVMMNP